MAWNETIRCRQCKQMRHVICGPDSSIRTICHDCENKNADKKKIEHLEKLAVLTMEERISRIEELLYDKPWVSMIRQQDFRF